MVKRWIQCDRLENRSIYIYIYYVYMLDYIRQITSDNLFLWCFVSWGCPNFGTLPEFVCFNCWSQLGEQWAVSSLNLARKIDCSASGVPADRIGSGDCQWNKTRNTQRMGALVGLWSLDLFSCEGPAPSCDKIAQRGAESVPRFGFALCREKSGSAEGFMPENVCSVSRCNPRKHMRIWNLGSLFMLITLSN